MGPPERDIWKLKLRVKKQDINKFPEETATSELVCCGTGAAGPALQAMMGIGFGRPMILTGLS